MIGLSFMGALLFVSLVAVVMGKHGMPDMVSSIYYLLDNRGWVFQIVMIAMGAIMMVCLLDSCKGEQCLAFLTCGGLMFVGAAPRFLEQDERIIHKSAAIVAAAASIGWCLTVDVGLTVAVLSLYAVYWVCKDDDSKPWFVAELMAIWLAFVTYWSTV